ncbi:MAG: hypothetical protein R3C44_12345 [Chloroflexota bacterium]
MNVALAGNTSAASIPIALCRHHPRRAATPQ